METETITPSADDVFSEQNKRKLFTNCKDMLNFIEFTQTPAAQFRMGYDKQGQLVYELVYMMREDV